MAATYTAANESVLRSRSSENVKDHGALGDGIAELATPFQDALDAAVTLGRDVFIPAGTYYVSDAASARVFHIARENTGTAPGVRIRGEAGTIIKLSTLTPRFIDFNKQAAHDWFRNLAVEDIEIDANQIGGSHHIILGVWQGSAIPASGVATQVNFENISVRRVRVRNVYTVDSASLTDNRMGVWLATNHVTSGEGTTNYIRNILFEDVVVGDGLTNGGNGGISVQGAAATGETPNILIDNIIFNRCRHDRGFSPQVYAGMNSFHVGSEAQVRDVTLRDCWSRGAGDTGLEINNAQNAHVDGFTAVDPYGIGWSTTNFRAVEYVEGQFVHFDNCQLRRTTDGPAGATPKGFVLGPPRPAVPIGTVKLSNCGAHFAEAPGFGASGYFLNAEDEQQVQHLILEGCKCHIEGVSGAIPDATTWTPMGMWVEIDGKLTIRGFDFKASGGVTLGAGSQLRSELLSIRGGDLVLDAEGLDIAYDVTNTYRVQAVAVWGSSAVRGRVRRLRSPDVIGPVGDAYVLGTGGSGQIDWLKFEDCDLSAFDGLTALTTAADIAKLTFHQNRLPASVSVASAAALNIPETEYVAVTGTTTITSITALRKGAIVTLAFVSALTVTDGSNLSLAGNFVTTSNDTITLVCDGTNWLEIARSVN